MRIIKLTMMLSILVYSSVKAIPCHTSSYTADASVTGMAGAIPVASVKIGSILTNEGTYSEVINIVEDNGTYTLTTVDLPNGPIRPSDVTVDQCD